MTDVLTKEKNQTIMKKWILSALMLLGFNACGKADDGITLLSPAEYAQAVKTDTTAVVLDVRRPEEFAEGHIAGARLLNVLDASAFEEGVKAMDKTKTYYVYCRSGRRSRDAALQIQKAGFAVKELQGGILAWKAAGMPVTQDGSAPR